MRLGLRQCVVVVAASTLLTGATAVATAVPRGASHPIACPAPKHGVGQTKDSLRLGTIADRTGPVAGLFAGAQQGIESFAQFMNASGGLCGRQVSIAFADSGTNCAQNQQVTRSLAKKAFTLVGSRSLYDGLGCGATALKHHPTVPDIHVAIDPSAKPLSNHFDLAPGPLGYATGMFAFYANKYGAKVQQVGTIGENVPSAIAQQHAIVHAAKSEGWTFTYANEASPSTSNFTSNFQRMCGKDHIRVFFTATENAQNAATMIANERSVAACNHVVNIIPVAYDQAFAPDYQGSKSDLNGLQGWSQYALYFNKAERLVNPEVALFRNWFRRTNPGQPLSESAMFAWASGRLFQAALERAKSSSRPAVLNSLRKIKNWSDNGLVAPITPSSKTDGAVCYILWSFKNGRFQRLGADPAITSDNPGGYRCDGTFLKS